MRLRLAALALVLLAAALFREAVFDGRVFYERDIHLQWHAQATELGRQLAAGQAPLWSPYPGFGQPLLANPNNQAAYPLSLLLAVLEPPRYYTLYVVLHVVVAGWGALWLARAIGLGALAAFLAALAFMLSGPMLSSVNLWNHLGGLAWMPWAWLCAVEVARRARVRSAVGLGFALAMMVLAGSPDAALLSAGAVLVLLAAGARSSSSAATWPRAAGAALLALGLAAALAAVQWLPSLDLLQRSARREYSPRERGHWSLFPATLPFAALPVPVHAVPLAPGARAKVLEAEGPYLKSHYLGLAALGLVCAAFAGPPHPWRRALAGVLGGALLLALGRHTPLYEVAVALLPPLGTLRFPVKAMWVGALAWSLLAGLGFEALRRGLVRRRALLLPGLAVSVGGAGLYLCGPGAGYVAGLLAPGVEPGRALAAVRSALQPAVLLGAAAFAACALAILARTPAGRGFAAGLAAVLAGADLYVAGAGLNPTVHPDFYSAPPQWVPPLRAELGRRVYVYDYLQFPLKSRQRLGVPAPPLRPMAPADGLAYMQAMRDYGVPPVLGAFQVEGSFDFDLLGLQPPRNASVARHLRDVEGRPLHRRLLQMAGVGLVVALHEKGFDDLLPETRFEGFFGPPIRVFRVPGALPRHLVVEGVWGVAGPEVLRAAADPAFDPASAVLLEGQASRPARPDFEGDARLLEKSPGHLRFEARANRASHLVVLDGYDPDWRATVDGQAAPLVRANLLFRAVALPPGRHVVDLRYRPRSAVAGAVVSVAGLLAAGLLAAGWRPRSA